MSLIIARKEGNRISIVSDTKLSYPDEKYPEKKFASPGDGVIKSMMLNPHVSISFAGVVEKEEINDLIRECRKSQFNIQKILEILLQFNQRSNGDTEFILAVSLPMIFKIYEIKNRTKRDCSSCWIGDVNAFNALQKNVDGQKRSKPGGSFQDHLEEGLKQIIDEGSVTSVSGFNINIHNEGGYFQYKSYVMMYIPEMVLPGGFHVITHGTPQAGGYTVHLFPSSDDYLALALHIQQGYFGVIYSAQNGGALWPEVFANIDEWELAEITLDKFKISPMGRTMSQQKSFFERGNKAMQKNEFEKAVDYYTRGLEIKETGFVGTLHYNKGIALFYLRKIPEAMRCFQEAVKINSSLQSKIFEFLKFHNVRRTQSH